MKRFINVLAQVVVLLVLVVSLFWAFCGLPFVIAFWTEPLMVLSEVIACLVAAFILLLGNHREGSYYSPKEKKYYYR